jgi:predicted acetyltransferase
MSIEIRPIAPEEFTAFAGADATAFGFEPNEAILEHVRPLFEVDRTLAAFDGEEIAGTTSIFSFDMTVPGARQPVAGVTWVSVKPTHRRRGVLTELMRRQLADVRERGEALATLWASESVIYGRFGYGLSAEQLEFDIARPYTAMSRAPNSPGRTRLISRDEALATWPSVFEQLLPRYPGMYARSDTWWRHHVMREPDISQGGGSRFYVQYEEDGLPLGYARYRIKGGQQNGLPDGTVSVQEAFGLTDAAYAAIWRYIFGVDLMSTVQARLRPVDEPLLWMLADPRRLVRRTMDSLWTRVVDAPAALSARRYASEGGVVLHVQDSFLPWAAGRFEVEGGPDGAHCRPSTAEPDVTLQAADLGAVYMGRPGFRSLARAGRVSGDANALARADAMFNWDPRPWCPEVF